MFIDTILNAAFALSVLTYYLGVLVYAIPIPWYGIKRWAPLLIFDGLLAASLTLFFNNIIIIIDYVYKILGADWKTFDLTMGSLWSLLIVFIIFIEVSLTLMTKLPYIKMYMFTSILFTIRSFLSYALLIITLIITLSIIVRYTATKMIALSILFYSVPFRITRVAGASLLAFTIVFYIGLPLMPNFMMFMALPTAMPEKLELFIEYGAIFPRIEIRSVAGDAIPFVILSAYDKQGILLARYISDSDGYAYASYPDKGFPAFPEVKLRAEYYGLDFTVSPSIIKPIEYFKMSEKVIRDTFQEASVTLPGILKYYKGIVVLNNPELTYNGMPTIVEHNNKIDILLNLSVSHNDSYEILLLPDSLSVSSVNFNNSTVEYFIDRLNWYDNVIEMVYVQLNESRGLLRIELAGSPSLVKPPESIKVPYVKTLTEGKDIDEVLRQASFIFMALMLVFPTSYIILLTMITYGLAYVLGARVPRIIFRV